MQAVENSHRLLKPEHERLLRWYYLQSGSATGLGCNLGFLLERMRDGLGRESDYNADGVDKQQAVALQLMQVTRALRIVGIRHEAILRAWVAPESYLTRVQDAEITPLGRSGPAMLQSPSLARWAKGKHDKGLAFALRALHVACKGGDPGVVAVMTRVRLETDEAVNAAAQAYAGAAKR